MATEIGNTKITWDPWCHIHCMYGEGGCSLGTILRVVLSHIVKVLGQRWEIGFFNACPRMGFLQARFQAIPYKWFGDWVGYKFKKMMMAMTMMTVMINSLLLQHYSDGGGGGGGRGWTEKELTYMQQRPNVWQHGCWWSSAMASHQGYSGTWHNCYNCTEKGRLGGMVWVCWFPKPQGHKCSLAWLAAAPLCSVELLAKHPEHLLLCMIGALCSRISDWSRHSWDATNTADNWVGKCCLNDYENCLGGQWWGNHSPYLGTLNIAVKVTHNHCTVYLHYLCLCLVSL